MHSLLILLILTSVELSRMPGPAQSEAQLSARIQGAATFYRDRTALWES